MARNVLVHRGTKLGRFIVVFILLSTLLLLLPAAAAAEFGHDDGQFQYPTGIAVDSEGNVYVADTSNYRIQKFDSVGGFLTKWGSVGSPVAITANSSGDVYVVDSNYKRILKFNGAGGLLAIWNSYEVDGVIYKFVSPKDVALDSSGNVFILDSDTWVNTAEYRIVKLDDEGGYLDRWGSPGTDPGQISTTPTGIALDSDDNVYVVDQYFDQDHQVSRIQKFDSSGNFITKWGSYGNNEDQLRFPYNLAFDSEDNAYVVDWRIESDWPFDRNPRIQKFDSEGAYITHWGTSGNQTGQFDHPGGIAVYSSEEESYVYVADTGNCRIQKFTSAGQFIDYIPPLNQPPVAVAGPDQTVILGETAYFDGSGSYDPNPWDWIVSYEWDFGDGGTGSGNTTTHIYSSGGTYTVTLTVTDDDGATDNDTTIVTVQTAEEALQYLILYVEEMSLPRGVENSLISKLEGAINSLNRDQKNAAANQLHAFINEVEALRDKKVINTEADELIAKAQQVIDNI